MPAAVPLSSSQAYSNQNFHTFQQQNNMQIRPHLPQNWINRSPSDYHVTTISGVPPEVLQNSSNSNAISLNHHSPQIFNQQSPQHQPPLRRSNPSASIQHHHQQSQNIPYSSPTETQNYINSPATPMSNPRPSPLPPPYPQNNGQSNFSNGVLSSANIANVNSTLLQEQRIHQQRIWEQQQQHHHHQQQQQQIMMQQIPWQQQSQQFRSPQHPHQVPSGPGMYSVPPNRYGYPAPTIIPTIPETPTKAAIPETPPKAAKASKKKKTPELNRLLNAPPDRLPNIQHSMQSVRPQRFQQHYHTNVQPISRPVMMRLPHQGFAVTNPQMNQQQQQANPNNLQQQYYMVPANQPQTMQMV
uniref:Uncharacterized protein n=1 Tax=Panagrolaimus sp. PS1159 TaxID=55785 RepID=A0AC35F5Y2_9BILA